MTLKTKHTGGISAEQLDKIIAAAYGGGFYLKIRVLLWRLRNEEADRIYKEYRAAADAVHSLTLEDCPENLTDKALKYAGADNKRRGSGFAFKPALAAALILAAGTYMLVTFIEKETPEPVYSRAEIIKADAEVKGSLQLVGRIFKRAQDRVEEDVLKKHVAAPVYKSIKTLNNILIGG